MPDTDASVAMEIVTGNSTIRFFNNTNPDLIRTTLQCLGGMSPAWWYFPCNQYLSGDWVHGYKKIHRWIVCNHYEKFQTGT